MSGRGVYCFVFSANRIQFTIVSANLVLIALCYLWLASCHHYMRVKNHKDEKPNVVDVPFEVRTILALYRQFFYSTIYVYIYIYYYSMLHHLIHLQSTDQQKLLQPGYWLRGRPKHLL